VNQNNFVVVMMYSDHNQRFSRERHRKPSSLKRHFSLRKQHREADLSYESIDGEVLGSGPKFCSLVRRNEINISRECEMLWCG
jgi:hypothetical protein